MESSKGLNLLPNTTFFDKVHNVLWVGVVPGAFLFKFVFQSQLTYSIY